MIDTHTHLYLEEFRGETADMNIADSSNSSGGEGVVGLDAVERALESGVKHLVFPNVGLTSMEPLLRLHHASPEGRTSVGVGLHPEEVDRDWLSKTEDVFARFEDEHPVAIGEVGIDLYHDTQWRMEQMDAFGDQIDRARRMQLPVIIHCREALDETLEIIRKFDPADRPKMIFHSFTGDSESAKRILEEVEGAMFGINGVVTFKNAAELRDALKLIPKERILLETDSPYLAPVPKRGRRNESSYLGYILEKIAEEKGISREEMERITDANAEGMLKLVTA